MPIFDGPWVTATRVSDGASVSDVAVAGGAEGSLPDTQAPTKDTQTHNVIRSLRGGVIGAHTAVAAPTELELVRALTVSDFAAQSEPVAERNMLFAACLVDDVSGTANNNIGSISNHAFLVTIDPAGADGCNAVRKSGPLITTDGSRLNIFAWGRFCASTFVAKYKYVLSGGTGRFAHTVGQGTWDVPAPDASTAPRA